MKRPAFLLAAAVLLTATPALALVKVTYTGTVASGSDETGLFGAPNGDLSDLIFRAVYLFDDTPEGQLFDPPFDSGWDGGFFDPGPKVFLTIGGKTQVTDCSFFVADYCNFTHHQRAAPGDWQVGSSVGAFVVDISPPTGAAVWSHDIEMGVSSTANPFLSSFDYRTPLDYVLQPGDSGVGTVSLFHALDLSTETERTGYNVQATLTLLTVSVAVPEPSTWAAMLLGFGILGAALRRRRSQHHASHTIMRVGTGSARAGLIRHSTSPV